MLGWLFGSKGKAISTGELKTKLQGKKEVVIDVREVGEYKGGHIPNAINVPLSKIESGLNKIPKNGEVYIICQSGMRSSRAVKFLQGKGYDNVINVKGGMSGWSGAVKR